jgi:hypothetical protein
MSMRVFIPSPVQVATALAMLEIRVSGLKSKKRFLR